MLISSRAQIELLRDRIGAKSARLLGEKMSGDRSLLLFISLEELELEALAGYSILAKLDPKSRRAAITLCKKELAKGLPCVAIDVGPNHFSERARLTSEGVIECSWYENPGYGLH